MAIDVVSAQSVDDLLPILAERLQQLQSDPFTPDIVVVPGVGMSDWIQERLAIRFGARGIVANTKFWLPNEFNANASLLSSTQLDVPDVAEMQWTILEYLREEELEGREPVPGFLLAKRKLSFAKRVAELFDKYAVHRPEMILDWNAGKNTDGNSELPDAQMWQPILWRHLYSRLGMTSATRAPFVKAEFQNARVTFFGLETFSRAKVELLKQLGENQDVKVLHLSPIQGIISTFRAQDFIVGEKRREQDLASQVKNPLLRSWSRSGLESAALLSTIATSAKSVSTDPATTVLGALQNTLATDADQSPIEKQSELLKMSDGSVQIHLCHGATRQVEVMRDSLLHILKSDSSLRPRDILILCTDLEKYAPLLEPVMGARLGADGLKLPISIIEKSNVTATAVAVAVDSLLALVTGRCTVLEVIETLSLEPVREKFGLEEDEIADISAWVNQLNVKWGIDSEHRTGWQYATEFEEGTWQLAIDRLATGMMLQSQRIEEHLPGVAGFDDISGSDIETVGKLFSFHSALKELQRVSRESHTAADWAGILRKAAETFLAVPKEDKQHLRDLASVVGRLESAGEIAPNAEFSLSEFREYVAESIPSIRQGSMKWGDVVRVASPTRLRGVSARVIAVLGFDEDAFHGTGANGDDILMRDPRLGERDRRSDERLGLLTMIHSAREKLVITCNGHDINNNKAIPLAVPMEELKDAIALAISTIPTSSRDNKPVVIHHSRQLADPVNIALESDATSKNVQSLLSDDEPWTFDNSAVDVVNQIAKLVGAEGASAEAFGYPILPPPIEKEIRTEVRLQDFWDAIRRPVDIYINQRLGVLLPRDEEAPEDDLPLWPNGLSYSEIGRELLGAIQEGETAPQWKKRKHLSGGLPIGALAAEVWKKVEEEVSAILQAAKTILDCPPTAVAVGTSLPDKELESMGGGELVVVDHVTVHQEVVLRMNFATWNRRMRVLPWLQLAVLTVQQPDVVWKAVVIAKAPKVKSTAKEPPPQEPYYSEEFVLKGETVEERVASARRVLEFANEIRTRARRVPLPLFESSSWLLDKSPSALGTDLGYDLERPAHEVVFQGRTLDEFRQEPLIDSMDLGLPAGLSRFEAYATWMTDTWTQTVHVLKAAEPVKKKAAGSAKKKKATQTPEADATGMED